MVFGDVAEGVAAHRTHINVVRKHGIDVVAVGSGNFDGGRIAVAHDRAGRGHGTALTGRRRHRVFVDGEHCRDAVVGTDIREGVAVGGLHRFAVHPYLRQVPAFRRDKRVGGVFAAVHRRLAFGRDGTRTLDRSRERVSIHREGGAQRVVFGDVAEGVAAHRTYINTVRKHGIDVMAI